MRELRSYSADRLARDLFLALIAHFEARLIARLRQVKANPSGTLGQLQAAIQGVVAVPQMLVEDVDEVRERRNALMHHDGHAHQRYIEASRRVVQRAAGYLVVPNVGERVVPDGRYLTYSANVLVGYSLQL